MIPEILNSNDGGIGALKRIGVNKQFMQDMYGKFGKYAGKIPGLNAINIGGTVQAIEKALDRSKGVSATSAKSNVHGFNSSKYPKV